jgi:hypothetical protein
MRLQIRWRRKKVIQAYTDDLLVFADTRELLNIFLEGLIQFMEYGHIRFNPKKCKIVIHKGEKIPIAPLFYQTQAILNKKWNCVT